MLLHPGAHYYCVWFFCALCAANKRWVVSVFSAKHLCFLVHFGLGWVVKPRIEGLLSHAHVLALVWLQGINMQACPLCLFLALSRHVCVVQAGLYLLFRYIVFAVINTLAMKGVCVGWRPHVAGGRAPSVPCFRRHPFSSQLVNTVVHTSCVLASVLPAPLGLSHPSTHSRTLARPPF